MTTAVGTRTVIKKALPRFGWRGGFSLAEILAALVIGSMLLIAVLGIYNRAERAGAAINRKLDSSRVPGEVLQRIAEDLDKLIAPGSETKITIANKLKSGFPAAKLTIVQNIVDSKNKEVTLEEIIWISGYDIESEAEGLTLYRGHSGITLEDKLLDDQRAGWEKGYPLVPICSGITFFEILVPSGKNLLDKWTSNSLPKGIVVTISFAESVRTSTGDYEVADEDKITRTIAIDRTRKIKFEIERRGDEEGLDNGRTGSI